jgi:hypothetical protein
MLSANECRERAQQYIRLSAEASDPIVKQRLAETAQGWASLAAELAKIEDRRPRSEIGRALERRKRSSVS